MQKLYRPSAPFRGAKVLWLPEGKQANRGFFLASCPNFSGPQSAREPSPFPDHPHGISIQKAKGKDQKRQNGLEPKGPTLTPLQATPSRLLGKRGGSQAQGTPHPWQCPEAPVFSITAKAFHPSPADPAGEGAATSVLIDSKDADSVELGQLGDEHTHQGHGVEDEVDLVVLGVEAGEEVQHDRCDG